MTDDEKSTLQDRFSGYQLPKVYLDAGFPSYEVQVHPYFYNQPLEWTKPAYTKYETTGPQLIEGQYPIQPSPSVDAPLEPPSITLPENETIVTGGSSGSSSSILGTRSGDNFEDNSNNLTNPVIKLLPF